MKLHVESPVFVTYQRVTKIEGIRRHGRHGRQCGIPKRSRPSYPMSREKPRNLK